MIRGKTQLHGMMVLEKEVFEMRAVRKKRFESLLPSLERQPLDRHLSG